MARTAENNGAFPRAIETSITTQDNLRAYDLDPQSPKLLTFAGPPGVDPKTLNVNDLPAGFRRIEAEEWEQLHNQT